MVIKEFTCIKCPLGCNLKVSKDKNNKLTISGNTCERGKEYAISEVSSPKRIVTALIKTKNCIFPCKTSAEIPKDKIFDVLKEIAKIKIKNGKIGDVVKKNIANTNADVVLTGNGSFLGKKNLV